MVDWPVEYDKVKPSPTLPPMEKSFNEIPADTSAFSVRFSLYELLIVTVVSVLIGKAATGS